MLSSTYPDDPPAEMDHPAQTAYPNVHGFPVDPIAHRPPGPFPHRLPPSAVYNPQTRGTDTYPFPPQNYPPVVSSAFYSATSIGDGPSYSQENALATPSSTTSSLPRTPFPSPAYASEESWASYNATLGSAPLISQEGHTQWTQPNASLNSHGNEGSAGAPQIYVTPDVHQLARPYYYPPTPPSIRPPDIELSSPPRQSPLTSNTAGLPYTPAEYYGSPTTLNESGFSESFPRQPVSPSPQPSEPATLHVLRVVQTRDLPRLETTRLEPRTQDPGAPSGNRWFIQTASPLLTPPGQYNGESRFPRSPQQASPKSSSNSSLTSPSPSSTASPLTFVAFAPANSTACQHEITEDKSISDAELNKFFPLESQGPMEIISPKGILGRKWTCQSQGCDKTVRRQDRMAHALEHQGKKRYICTCGATFARSQDQKRHLREQAVCRNCERAVGRNGASGVCSSCSPKRRRRGRSSCTFSDSNANANA